MSRVELATPVSHLFEDPAIAERIIAVSDCLEARERNLDKAFENQRLFHIDIDLVHEWSDERRSYLTNAFAQLPSLALATLQVAVNCDAPVLDGVMYRLGGHRYGRTEMLKYAERNVEWLRRILPPGVKLGVENNNYYPSPAYDIVTDPDFLSELVDRTGIHLLLDVAHAMVTAHNTGTTFQAYLDALPLNRCIQLHLCQPRIREDGLAIDAHDAPDEAMVRRALELTERFPVKYVTVEFYQDPDILIDSLKELRARLP